MPLLRHHGLGFTSVPARMKNKWAAEVDTTNRNRNQNQNQSQDSGAPAAINPRADIALFKSFLHITVLFQLSISTF